MRFTVAAALVAGLVVALAAAEVGADEPKATYVGSSKCMKCHSKQLLSWKKTKLAASMETLKPATDEASKARAEVLKKAGLDPAKDYTTDAKCLPCHVTGYGKEGGYPEKITADNEAVVKAMGSVSCESCHGPGSRYVEYKNQKRKENKDATFTREEMEKLGLVHPTEETCKACHNDTAPIKPETAFKFEEAKAKVHDHVELKGDKK
jgi:hypothetical protein